MKDGKAERSIFIDVCEWRDKVNGNTYYSANVSVDGLWQFSTGMKYGYGDQARHDVGEELIRRGVLTEGESHLALRYVAEYQGIDLYVSYRDVLKRELPKFAQRNYVNANS